ncbi:hypothetical protein EGW08_004340 [Elysia chlorotica]|uniref:Uncharacterized protein n=1 Tax=Elysia chlorotica TaxID=188477 RepID=A0A3S1BSS4_ELYCH|nr:hypothetical protein EGW08_004340 [Elysia chlorotica]
MENKRMSRVISSEEKTWRTYSKSLIVELKEKLAARRARTLGLLSEGGDSSAFCELDTESDGLDDTSSHSHEVKDHFARQALDENGPEVTSLSETSSMSDNMEFCNLLEEDAPRNEDYDMQPKKISYVTIATECESFSPPRVDNTTMTSAKFRFEGDRELVSVGTECDGFHEFLENSKKLITKKHVSTLDFVDTSFEFPGLLQVENEVKHDEESCNNAVAEIDSIEATYSSAVQYFRASSQDNNCDFANIPSAKRPDKSPRMHETDLFQISNNTLDIENVSPNGALDCYPPNTFGLPKEGMDKYVIGEARITPEDLITEAKELNSICYPNEITLKNSTVFQEQEFTKVDLGAGDFELYESPPKRDTSFCSSLIDQAEELLRNELSVTTYRCALEETLRVIKSDTAFNTEVDKNVVLLLEDHLDKNQSFQYGDQNVSSNSGNDRTGHRPKNESTSKEANIVAFQKNQRLQSCLKKAKLVSTLQLNHDTAATKKGKVVTKQAYDKAVREFEALVTRFVSFDMNEEHSPEPSQVKNLDKHPHVTSLPPFGASRGSISSKTFICNNNDKVESNAQNTDSKQLFELEDTFAIEDNVGSNEKITSSDTNKSVYGCLIGGPSSAPSHSQQKKDANLGLAHVEIKSHTKEGMLISKERKHEAGVDESDSDSAESHESGFCSNQVYTSSLLTQLLDYSSQEEDIVDMEEVSKEQNLEANEPKGNIKDTGEPEISIIMDLNYQSDSDQIPRERKDREEEQNSCLENIIECVKNDRVDKDANLDGIVVYESDFETGSDSDTTLQTSYIGKTKKFGSGKNKKPLEYGLSTEKLSNKSGKFKTVPSTNRQEEADTYGQGIQDNECANIDQNIPEVSKQASDIGHFGNNFDTNFDTGESSLHQVCSQIKDSQQCCSTNSADKDVSSTSCGKYKPYTLQNSSKKKLRSLLPKVDLSSSDEDSADDIISDLSPAEILRQRQIEQVDGRLEQLKEISKRKRKSRSPFKHSSQKKETSETVSDFCNPSEINQCENRCTVTSKISEDAPDYKDPKLLSSCLDLLTKRRKLKEIGESLYDSALNSDLDKENHNYTKECYSNQLSQGFSKETIAVELSMLNYDVEPTNPVTVEKDISPPEVPLHQDNNVDAASEIKVAIDNSASRLSHQGWSSESEEEEKKTAAEVCSRETRNTVIKAPGSNDNGACDDENSGETSNGDASNQTVASVPNSANPIEDPARNDDTETPYMNSQVSAAELTPTEWIEGKHVTESSPDLDGSNGKGVHTVLDNESAVLSYGIHDNYSTSGEAGLLNKYPSGETGSIPLTNTLEDEESGNIKGESGIISNNSIDMTEMSENGDIINTEESETSNDEITSNYASTNNQIALDTFPRRDDKENKLDYSEFDTLDSEYCHVRQEGTNTAQPQNELELKNQTVNRVNDEPLTDPSYSCYETNETRHTDDSGSKEIWQMIGTVNDFYSFLLKTKARKPDDKENNIYCVCNPDSLHHSSFIQNSITVLSKSLSPCMFKENTTFTEADEVSEKANQQDFQSSSHEAGFVPFTEGKVAANTLLHDYETGANMLVVKKLKVLEDLLYDNTHCQEQIKTLVNEIRERSDYLQPREGVAKPNEENSDDIRESWKNPDGSDRYKAHQHTPVDLVHASTQTTDLATQACQTEDTSFQDQATDLKNSLQSCIQENVKFLQDKIENIESEMRARGKEYDLSTSKLADIDQRMTDRNDQMDKRAQESQNHLEGKIECLKNTISAGVESSIGAWRENLSENYRGQIRDMLQEMKTELVASTRQACNEVSVGITALKESLEMQNKIKELYEAANEKKCAGDEWKSPHINKGMDVDTMKMRIVELTSQRDAEKVFHKITRQSLRALERDHERLREEYLGSRLRRERKTADSDPRRNFKHFMSQQCSYCFNNNRAQVERPKDDKKKSDQRDSDTVLRNPPQTCDIRKNESVSTGELLETKEWSDCQQSKCNDAKGFDERNGHL